MKIVAIVDALVEYSGGEIDCDCEFSSRWRADKLL
jgi:hypothetical protein